ncbi:car [Symbiodinium sp. CCMP2456]|nr:car [Symbiodinium sp. CCMP2456]
MSSEKLLEVAERGSPGRGAYPAGAASDSTGVSPTEQVWNGFKTSRGLIVSQVYRLNGQVVVDIFEEEMQSLTPVPFSDLGLEDVSPDPVSLLPSQRRKVEGWNLQETLRNAFGVLALRPALGELGKKGELKWTTWRTLGQRSTDLSRYLTSILPKSACVILSARNSVDWIVALLAIVLAGCMAVPLHFLAQESFREAVSAEADVRAAFTDVPKSWKSVRVLDLGKMRELEAQGASLRKSDELKDASLSSLKLQLQGFLEDLQKAHQIPKSATSARHALQAFLAAEKWDDELGQLIVMLARHDMQWLTALAAPGVVGPLTLRALAESWMPAQARAQWEAVGERFGDVWLTAVLEALSRHRRPDSDCLAYALRLGRRQTLLDPWAVELVCRLAASLPLHAQQAWFDLADKVAPAKVGASYEVLRATPLRSSRENDQEVYELAEGSVVEVLQVSGSAVEVASEVAQGWIDLWDGSGAPIMDETIPEPIAMILYTSGSTGAPKGALIKNSALNRYMCNRISTGESDFSGVLIHGAPLSTSASPYNIFGNILGGGRSVILEEGGQLFELAPLVGPTQLGGVPQMWALLYKRFQDRLSSCDEAGARALREEAKSWLGPRIHRINCGGALPCPAVMRWLQSTYSDAEVSENYGLTEAGGITASGPGQLPPIKDGVQVRLEDFGMYKTTDVPPRGEICVKTQRMAAGYLNRPDITSESFTSDGFFRTGDIGEMPDPKHLRVIDRKKAFFKLSNGEWVSPEAVEAILMECPEVQQVLVHGDSAHDCIVAVAVARVPAEQVLDAFRGIMQLRTGLRHFETPQAVHVTSEAWDANNGLLTATGKLCRRKILEHFATPIQEMLESGKDDRTEHEVVRLIRQGTDEKAWQELNLTSVAAVSAAHAIRLFFGVDVSVIHLLQKPPLAAMKAHVEGRQQLSLSTREELTGLGGFVPMSGERSSKILLTGATGHVGACVLQHLVISGLRVTTLVRGSSHASAEKRLLETLLRRGYNEAAEQLRLDGVRVVAGDLSEEFCNLPEEEFRDLAGGISLHVAAEVHHLQSYSTLEATNVQGTRRLLMLTALAPTKFVLISTESAQESRRSSGYGQTKHAAESLVQEALSCGMQGSILQLGMVGPDRVTGASNVQDWLIRYVLGALQLGAWHGPGSLRLFPCEEVAKAIVARIHDDTCKPAACVLPSAILMGLVASSEVLPRRIRQVALAEWQELLADLPESNPMFPLRHYYWRGLGRDLTEEGPHGYDQDSVNCMLKFLDREGLFPKALLQRTKSSNRAADIPSRPSLHRSISQPSEHEGSSPN